MGRSYSWTARVGGRTVADGTAAGGGDYTAEHAEREAAEGVALRAGVRVADVNVSATERKSARQQAAEARNRG
ncbi:hypothetical protein TUSST3_09040 [Streptomyces sp. TUS-ST3]|uniref:hypothetical protein n=1 Tax=Streptomyces sp. TUS-ST3 TaxID=3025591 RepID=UPI0024E15C90|nr:hypothetical protein [Streptomyces sp. TUS-ST3]GLP64284.1 hypothetical protein TUSST3_09040 [Streptomyces sp. TUS-ST3]